MIGLSFTHWCFYFYGVHKLTIRRFLNICNNCYDFAYFIHDPSLIRYLPTHFCIERCLIKDHLSFTFCDFIQKRLTFNDDQ